MVGDLVEDLSSCTLPLYDGGPVGKEQMFFLHCMPEIIPGGIHINAGIYWGGDFDKVKELVATNTIDEKKIRFIVGYSGWEGGQLEEEIKEKKEEQQEKAEKEKEAKAKEEKEKQEKAKEEKAKEEKQKQENAKKEPEKK